MRVVHFNAKLKQVEYSWLTAKHSIKALFHSMEVFVAEQGTRRSITIKVCDR
ncbi:MAG TPA: hypothetical protein VJK54_01560 [Chthoniobacterales bacterium]|nr:hypothetical protein [Chthoniobacterales bacterium]